MRIFLPLVALLLSCPCASPVFADAASDNQILSECSSRLYKRRGLPAAKEARIKAAQEMLAEAQAALDAARDAPPDSEGRGTLTRVVMLPLAEQLYEAAPTPEHRATLLRIAEGVVKFPVYDAGVYGERRKPLAQSKAHAGYVLARAAIYSEPGAKPVDAEKHIRAMLALFPERDELKGSADVKASARVAAARLAQEAGETALLEELCEVIATRHLAVPDALDTLASAGRPAVFKGELILLDGTKLNLPDDAKGKVVLVDFWATWCGPCVQSLPHIRDLNEKYKDRGVMVLGISCDSPNDTETPEANRGKVSDFLKKNNYTWAQAYSGSFPEIGTRYGVSAIPRVFVLDKNGRILSTQARGQEERLIEQALAAPAAK